MILSPAAHFENTCIHEANHAVVAVALGVRIETAEVLPPWVKRCRSGGVTTATAPTLHQSVLIGLAGHLGEHRGISLAQLRRYYRLGDIACLEAEVRDYFTVKARLLADPPQPELIHALVSGYIRPRFGCLKRWLFLDETQQAVRDVANELRRKALLTSLLGHDEVAALCAPHGIVPVPPQLRPQERLPLARRYVRLWSTSSST